MTLREYMKDTEKKYIKVGAENGSSFIYCGTPSDFDEFERDYSKEEYARLEKSVKTLTKELQAFVQSSEERFYSSIVEFCEDRIRKTGKSEFVNFRSVVEYSAYIKNLDVLKRTKLQRQLERAQILLYFFTDIGEREVVKIDESTTTNKYGEQEEIILFHGYEKGTYWTIDEFESGVVEDEDE